MPATSISIRAAAALTGADVTALWWDCLALGETGISQDDVAGALADDPTVDSRVLSMVALAIDEKLLDLGLGALLADRNLHEASSSVQRDTRRAAVSTRSATLRETASTLAERARIAHGTAADTCALSRRLVGASQASHRSLVLRRMALGVYASGFSEKRAGRRCRGAHVASRSSAGSPAHD